MRLVRYVVVLLVITLAVPGAAAVLASGGTSNQRALRAVIGPAGTSSRQAVRAVAGAPAAAFSVAGIQFSLEKGDNAQPIDPDTRFKYGTRSVWAFWSWSDAKDGSQVKWVLRFGGSDVNFGTITTDGKDGRMEVLLERQDGHRFDIGIYRLQLEPISGDAGNVVSAEFEIYDPDVEHHDGDDNDNDGDDDDDDDDDSDDNDNDGDHDNEDDDDDDDEDDNDNGDN